MRTRRSGTLGSIRATKKAASRPRWTGDAANVVRRSERTFRFVPSVDLNCSFTPDHLLPLPDTCTLMETLRAGEVPIFVWEYGEMTPAHAEALLGPPAVRHVRVGRSRPDSLSVVWETSVPARSVLTGPAKTSRSASLELTQSGSLARLTPGTAYPLTLQSSSGGGSSPLVPLTVATAPLKPGVYVQSVLAERSALGHVTLTISVANSTDAPVTDVQITAVTVDGASVLAPTPLPYALGPLGKRDWQASTRDRSALEVVVTGLPAASSQVMVHISGTADGSPWSSALPVALAG